jgi:hypothetical protein
MCCLLSASEMSKKPSALQCSSYRTRTLVLHDGSARSSFRLRSASPCDRSSQHSSPIRQRSSFRLPAPGTHRASRSRVRTLRGLRRCAVRLTSAPPHRPTSSGPHSSLRAEPACPILIFVYPSRPTGCCPLSRYRSLALAPHNVKLSCAAASDRTSPAAEGTNRSRRPSRRQLQRHVSLPLFAAPGTLPTPMQNTQAGHPCLVGTHCCLACARESRCLICCLLHARVRPRALCSPPPHSPWFRFPFLFPSASTIERPASVSSVRTHEVG